MRKELNNAHFDNRPRKKAAENYIYTQIGKIVTSSALVITGPSLERHIPNIMKITTHQSCKGYCIENDTRVYYGEHGIQERYNNLTQQEKHKIKIAFGDVTGYMKIFGLRYPCRFIDLDLCRTLNSTSLIIANCLRVQATYRKDMHKFFMFTASYPRTTEGMEEYLFELDRTILSEIDARINIESMLRMRKENKPWGWKKLGHYMKRWTPIFLEHGRISEQNMPLESNGFLLYNYKETSQMITCAFIYK